MAGGRSAQLGAYLAAARLTEPLWRLAMSARVRRGKEDPARLPEKFGHSALPRPEGRLVWFHALSVGESLALLPLLHLIADRHPRVTLLVTTTTRTSVEALSRQALPATVIHQLLPVDAAGPVRRFLDHWRPDAAIFAELDFWPALMAATHDRGIPMLLINSRMSDRNYAKRRKGAAMFGDLLRMFDRALLQNDATRDRFVSLGADAARLDVTGALKGAPVTLPADPALCRALGAAIGDRPVWLAASTEAREEAALAEAHLAVLARQPDALMVMAPRHPRLAEATRAHLDARFDRVAQRSQGQDPDTGTQTYLADTIGEMGLWYRLAGVTFMGHSLEVAGPPLAGKNPFEAMVFDTAVLHGPSVGDFDETYARLDTAGAALRVARNDDIADAVLSAFAPETRAAMTAAAETVLAETRAVIDDTYTAIAPHLGPAEPAPDQAPAAPIR